jgi:hypothetical protein
MPDLTEAERHAQNIQRTIHDFEYLADEFERRAKNLRRMAQNLRDGKPRHTGIGEGC